jgi:hypothetical protein
VRLFLRAAAPEDGVVFAEAVREASLHWTSRYVIPRYADEVLTPGSPTCYPSFSPLLPPPRPAIKLCSRRAVGVGPEEGTCRHFARHWNRHEPGRSSHAHRGPGQELLENARWRGRCPRAWPATKRCSCSAWLPIRQSPIHTARQLASDLSSGWRQTPQCGGGATRDCQYAAVADELISSPFRILDAVTARRRRAVHALTT